MKVALSPNLSKFALAFGIALSLGACASSEAPVPQTAEEAVAALESAPIEVADNENEDEDLICRSEIRTGTNFKRRTCRTAEEWNARSAAQRRVVEDRANNARAQDAAENAGGGTTNAVGL